MKVTKFGHCCLLIEEREARLLTDPGSYSNGYTEIEKIDAILITHEHSDHLHVPSLKKVLEKNPHAKVFTNLDTAKRLKDAQISFELLSYGKNIHVKGVLIEAYGERHEKIYGNTPDCDNTGFFIAGKFFYPGDAFTDPKRPIDVLALPVAGPWVMLGDSIKYGKKLKPRLAFPVHDGGLKHLGSVNSLPASELAKDGIEFIILEHGIEYEV